MTKFQEKVYNIVKSVRPGHTITYAEIARKIDNPKAARAVGNALHKNFSKSIPCHRVIRSDGKIGGYNRGTDLKLKLLKKERAF